MIIYLFIFIISLFLIKISYKVKNNKIASFLCSFFAILFPCLLAAFRDLSIGTDVKVYIEPLFSASLRYSSFLSFFGDVVNITDFLYLLLTYISSRVSSNIAYLFFLTQFLVIVPIFIALKIRYKESNRVIFGMFLYYMFFFNQSLNMARQSIAISFIILALALLDKNDKIKFFLFSIIAFLFHNSAIVFLPIYLLYIYIKSGKLKKLGKFFIVLSLVIILFIFPTVITFSYKLGLISYAKFYLYGNQFIRAGIDFSYINSFIYLFIYLLMNFRKKNIEENTNNGEFYVFSSLLSLIILQFGAIVTYSDRIGYYLFYPILITVLPSIFASNQNHEIMKKNDLIIKFFVYLIFISYWLYWIIYLNYNGTYPYVSIFN